MENGILRQAGEKPAIRDFFHHLHDTLVLLGAGANLANLVQSPETINESDVDNLRRYNCKLIDTTKDKLVNINKLAVVVGE
jgi:hypothetical protein